MPLAIKIFLGYCLLVTVLLILHHFLKKEQRRQDEEAMRELYNQKEANQKVRLGHHLGSRTGFIPAQQ
jgi:hypothetical protein